MYSNVMLVTPEMAKAWLGTNEHNRNLRNTTVAKYAADMKAGKWNLTHQGIAFNKKHELIDGQHRLMAVVRSGASVQMLVTFDSDDSTHLDDGLHRNTSDALYMAGLIDKHSPINDKSVQSLVGYIIKRSSAYEYRTLTPEKRYNVYTYYQNVIDPVFTQVMRRDGVNGKIARNTTTAPVHYAILCAYAAGVDIPTLRMWNNILRTGDPFDENDHTQIWYRGVIHFRNWLSDTNAHTIGDDEEIMRRAMWSINKFYHHEPVTAIHGNQTFEDLPVTTQILYKEV